MPRKLCVCVWRNDNKTDPSDQMTHKLYKVVCPSVPNVMPNQGGERGGSTLCTSLKKWMKMKMKLAQRGGCFLRQQRRQLKFLVGFSVFHRIKITIIYIWLSIDASMTFSVLSLTCSVQFVNVCAPNYARHCGWTGLPMDLFIRHQKTKTKTKRIIRT